MPQLQVRTKWLLSHRNVMVGDFVLLLDESTPRSLWPLALVIETKTGRDCLVRCVRVKTKASKGLVRPISKIVFLEAFGEDVVTTDVH